MLVTLHEFDLVDRSFIRHLVSSEETKTTKINSYTVKKILWEIIITYYVKLPNIVFVLTMSFF